jgi:choline-sulfatase
MASRPDLVLFMTDQQRFDQVGYESDGYFETPNIDALAEQGVLFTNAYSGSTTCVPARASLLTGLYHHRVPTQVNRLALREGFWTVARSLRTAGYETALIGKMHFAPVRADHGFETMRLCEHVDPAEAGSTDHPGHEALDDYHDWLVAQGLKDWRFESPKALADAKSFVDTHRLFPYQREAHPTSWVASEAVSFLEKRDRSRPLLLIVSFPHPHAPYNPPAPYDDLYDAADAVLPTDGFELNDRLPFSFRMAMEQGVGPFAPHRLDHKGAEARRWLTAVRSLVKHIDDAMGEVLEHVDLARSVVFFTSDHGDFAGHRGMLKKVPWIPFDDLARVPLLVAGFGVVPGRRLSVLVHSCDFALTCLDYGGVEMTPDLFDTRSLRPLLEDRASPADNDRLLFCATSTAWPMVRKGSLKYILERSTGTAVLFDLDSDPDETTNVLDDPARRSVFKELSELLSSELQRGTPKIEDLPPADYGDREESGAFQLPLSLLLATPFPKVEPVARARWLIDHVCAHAGLEDLGATEMLDMGCGATFTEGLLDGALPVEKYVGCDVSAELIQYLRDQVTDSRFEYFHLAMSDSLYDPNGPPLNVTDPLPIDGRTFDVITALSVFTHLEPSRYRDLLRVLRRFAKPDTVLLFSLHIDEVTRGGHGLIDGLARALAESETEYIERISEEMAAGSGETGREPFRDMDPRQPLRWMLYSRPYASALIEGTGWKVEGLYPPHRHIQHHFVCTPD